MGEGKASPKIWAIVGIAVAIIGCIGTTLAAAVGILPDFLSPEPLYTLVPQVNTPVDDSGESATSTALVNTVSPAVTPPPTYTSYPTYTPYPTHTPCPTEASIPTSVSVPTSTPTSTPAPVPTSDPRLEVGETWTEDGVSLTMNEVAFSESGGVLIDLLLENNTGQSISFLWTVDDFTLIDNQGNKYEFGPGCPGFINNDEQVQVIVGSGQRYRFDSNCMGNPFWFYGDAFFQQSVTEMTFTVRRISRVEFVQWRITVPH